MPQILDLPLPYVHLAALAWGPEDGPLVVALHGFPDTAWTWRHLGPHLAERGFRVVAPFTRGYGPSEVPADGCYQVGALMADAAALHDVLDGDERAVLVGHDWGAITANGLRAHERDPAKLWAHLAERLIPAKANEFETVATLLWLAYAGTSPDAAVPREQVALALWELGWRHGDGRPLEGYELYRLDVFNTLVNVSDRLAKLDDRNWVSPAAAALSRAALHHALSPAMSMGPS